MTPEEKYKAAIRAGGAEAEEAIAPGATLPKLPSATERKLENLAESIQPGDAEYKDMWKRLAAGGYETINKYLMGLPDFLLKKVIKSPAYADLKALREQYPAETALGGVTGAVGGAFQSPIMKGLKTVAAVPKVSKIAGTVVSPGVEGSAAKAVDFARKLTQMGPWGQAALQASVPAAIKGATTDDWKEAAKEAAIGTAVGGVVGSLGSKSVKNALAAKAEKASELPKNLRIAKSGLTAGDLAAGMSEATRKNYLDAVAAAKEAGLKVEKGTRRILAKSAREEAIDPLKDVLDEVIKTYGLRDADALAQFGAQPLNKIRERIVGAFAGKENIDPDALQQAAEALKSASLRDKMGELSEALGIGKKVASGAEGFAKKALIGAGVGGLAGGGLSLQEGKFDPKAVATGAAIGLVPSALGAIAPLAASKGAEVLSPALSKLAEAPGGAIEAVGKAAARVPGALPEKQKKEEAPVPEEEVDLSDWYSKLDEIAQAQWSNLRKDPNFKTSYADWFDANIEGSLDPEALARSDSPILTDKDKEAILRDYVAKKQMKGIDWQHFLGYRGLGERYLGVGADPDKDYKEQELFRTLLAPKPGSIVSSSAKQQLEQDLDMIRKRSIPVEEKKDLFMKLLIERYGYNPDYLARLGLGE